MANPDPDVHLSRQFPKLSLGGLFFFGLYARAAIRSYPHNGVSFRSFVKHLGDGRTHRVLVKMAHRLEYQSQKLLMNREYREARGSMVLASSYEEAEEFQAKRNGTMTKYGEAWCELIEHMADLYDLAIDAEDDDKLLAVIEAQRNQLKAAADRARAHRKAEDFDTL